MTGVERVILDANALMAPGRSGVDVLDEVERLVGAVDLLVPAAVRRELRGLAADDPDAELGLEILEDRCTVVDTGKDGTAGRGDEAIVALAADDDVVAVVTNDAALRDRLHDVDVPVLFLRQERYLDISHP